MHPDNPWATYVGIASCFLKQGKMLEALRYYEAALKMQPDNPALANYVKALRTRLGIYPTPTPGNSLMVPSQTAGSAAPSASATKAP
jgi:tetratricopeptide (TPR) repeat protein